MKTVISRFEDSRGWCCAAFNEVSIDYNAAFTGALARLAAFYDGMKSFSDCTLELGWTHPNATLVRHQVKSNAGICLCLRCELPGLPWSALDHQAGILNSCLMQPSSACSFENSGRGSAWSKGSHPLPCRPQSRSGRRTTATTAAAMARRLPPRQQWSAAARR